MCWADVAQAWSNSAFPGLIVDRIPFWGLISLIYDLVLDDASVKNLKLQGFKRNRGRCDLG